jgi:Asp-tRNA(Asn)/Glu-tRNA(Gln) amidotransferase A subunit family amidase
MSTGFIALRVEDLAAATSILLNECPAGDIQPHAPARLACDPSLLAGLRVGVWSDDGYFPAAPAVVRAVDVARQRLAASGATAVDFSPPSVYDAMRIYFGLMNADGGAELRALARGSRLDRRVRRMLRYGRIPVKIRPTIAALLRGAKRGRLAHLLLASGRKSAEQVEQLLIDRTAYCERFEAQMDETGVDLLLSPPHALAAFPHGLGFELLPAGSYSLLMNLLAFPAGVAPVTMVENDEDDIRIGGDPLERLAWFSQRDSVGLPVGAQVAARPGREDLVLAAMSAIEAR